MFIFSVLDIDGEREKKFRDPYQSLNARINPQETWHAYHGT
jgi:hypothetical protein